VASAGIREFGVLFKSNCDLRGRDTLTIELRRVLSGVLREPGKSDASKRRGLSKAILAMQLRLKLRPQYCLYSFFIKVSPRCGALYRT